MLDVLPARAMLVECAAGPELLRTTLVELPLVAARLPKQRVEAARVATESRSEEGLP